MRKPKIAVIGGGTGISVILDSLRKRDVDISAIVTVADDGGSSGELRKNTQLTPPGDLRNVLVALSDMPKFYERVFQYRFADQDGPLAGHPLKSPKPAVRLFRPFWTAIWSYLVLDLFLPLFCQIW